ncbi:MAG: cation diffusion facilitator family transporter [Paludibacteraceae bacterium]|nr:cation diffusion facilitator family transporter [Paludibacteraceae bacterium]
MDNTIEIRQKEIVKVTLIGTIINAILIILKFTAGIIGNSAAMVADGVHSLSDFLTDFVVIVMLKISSKPSDEDHDFGHGKYETLATTIIGLLLILVGGGILFSGATKIYGFINGEDLVSPGWLAFGAAIASILLKEGIFQYTIVKSDTLKSEALVANAWHHRSDALSSIGTAIGIGAACLLGDKWAILDPLAAVIVSFFIFKVAIQLIRSSVSQLLESSLPKEIEDQIETIVNSYPGVTEMHDLCTRQVGVNYAITMHVRMDGNITLYESHKKVDLIENDLKEKFGHQTIISIHVEPWE